ncbi:Fe2OG dioxygenase domain-containing protein, partial [Haematococcus lacustris]
MATAPTTSRLPVPPAGHDHSGPPPEDKWELACVDRVGDQATWGLRQHMLQALEHDPPDALLALQARLAALYPEYQLCHMPADMLSEDAGEAGEEEGGAGLSSFVGNAVMAGDPCSWHDDANPAMLPPTSPWVHCYGYYYNREPGRPRFVSMLLYLNDAWPDELHAETLFVDPSTQVGVFARPAPGRVVLMDQDTSHRISPPSAVAAGAPRYSLVEYVHNANAEIT